MAEPSTWHKWLQNGRLSALSFLIILIVWIVFALLKIPAPILDQLLITFSGILVGNLAMKKQSDDEKQKKDDKNASSP